MAVAGAPASLKQKKAKMSAAMAELKAKAAADQPVAHTYNLVLILTRHTLARAGLANRLY